MDTTQFAKTSVFFVCFFFFFFGGGVAGGGGDRSYRVERLLKFPPHCTFIERSGV